MTYWKSGGGSRPRIEDSHENIANRLYVGNLDPRVTEYGILTLFKPFGEIVREDFAWHMFGERKGSPKGFCFIEYSKKEEAEAALKEMNGKILLDRPMRVYFAKEHRELTEPTAQSSSTSTSTSSLYSAPVPTPAETERRKADIAAKIHQIKSKLRVMKQQSSSDDNPSSSSSSSTTTTSSSSTHRHKSHFRYQPYSARPPHHHHHRPPQPPPP
eukprot:TRINITY_DN2228_c2_g2_i1.p1 TRINITY_DN2228_c2_g2~~TRINITY_DN2228_c2_g2_i1.p1  ORF type:complete len:214 (-),score=83.64 TRINITY_DN2228_c2_g2_i1:30-671(-)